MRVLVIIPAYNEEDNIRKTVNRIQSIGNLDYVVVNDGSKDSTAFICRKCGFDMIDLPINLGLAGAFQAGMKYAYYNNYDYAIQFDGDGQHNPEYIEPMMKYAKDNNKDIVIGSRFVEHKKNHSLRMLGNTLIEFCVLLTTGKRVKDPTSGMRLFNKELIKILATQSNFGPEPDTVAFLIRCGAEVGEYQVHMNDREAGESYLNFSNSIKYMFNICSSILFVQWFRKKVKICRSI